ncbi:MAG: type II toxin-antitoxin system HicB family antitoxin [Thermoplasmata archaeon]
MNIYEAEEGGYWADCPDLPGCGSQGRTMQEVKRNVAEAIELYMETLAEQVAGPRHGRPGRPIKSLRMELAAV